MAYRQYTRCVSPSKYIGKVAAQVIVGSAIAAFPLLAVLLAGGALVPPLMLVILGAIIAYCRWWLYDRLICLNGDVCAIGAILKIETPDKKSGLDRFDTDYSMSLILPPNPIGATQAEAEAGPQGNLVKEQPGISARGLDFQGNLVQRWTNGSVTATLHCEFEGAGVYDLLIACLGAFALAAAATVACSVPIIGWAICLILSIIAAAVLAVGIVVALNDVGNPADVNDHLGELHQLDEFGHADVVVVQGTWVYDSAHEGWNEIHPIKHCQKTGTFDGGWAGLTASEVQADVDRWCKAIDDASTPGTRTNQLNPENRWTIHPLIDGCQPSTSPPSPIH